MLKGSCTNKSLWIAAACSFVLILGVGVGVVLASPGIPVTICHKGNTITVNSNAISAHVKHGDSFAGCDQGVCACQPSIDFVTCLSDGNTYINRCVAECAGATGCFRTGGCQQACSKIFDPVSCHSNGNTYNNQCLATCDGARDCVPTTACTREYDPVFCTIQDGEPLNVIYANQCIADAYNASGCSPFCDSACSRIYDPVACENSLIYNNACLAACDGQINCIPATSCSKIYDPVICDGPIVYANRCIADAYGATGCGPDCPACPRDYDPVLCSSDGNTYNNLCVAICEGQFNCERIAAACSKLHDPVECTLDGARVVFGNQCLADFAGATGCAELCACEDVIIPVSCDHMAKEDVPYVNQCAAACDGATNCVAICECPGPRQEVTCSDGNNYGNQCIADCQGATGCSATPLGATKPAFRKLDPAQSPLRSVKAKPSR